MLSACLSALQRARPDDEELQKALLLAQQTLKAANKNIKQPENTPII